MPRHKQRERVSWGPLHLAGCHEPPAERSLGVRKCRLRKGTAGAGSQHLSVDPGRGFKSGRAAWRRPSGDSTEARTAGGLQQAVLEGPQHL